MKNDLLIPYAFHVGTEAHLRRIHNSILVVIWVLLFCCLPVFVWLIAPMFTFHITIFTMMTVVATIIYLDQKSYKRNLDIKSLESYFDELNKSYGEAVRDEIFQQTLYDNLKEVFNHNNSLIDEMSTHRQFAWRMLGLIYTIAIFLPLLN